MGERWYGNPEVSGLSLCHFQKISIFLDIFFLLSRRYVLVTKVSDEPHEAPVPTALERQLLAERFPRATRQLRNLPEPRKRGSSPSREQVNVSGVADAAFC